MLFTASASVKTVNNTSFFVPNIAASQKLNGSQSTKQTNQSSLSRKPEQLRCDWGPLLISIGPPCSGKSSFTKALQEPLVNFCLNERKEVYAIVSLVDAFAVCARTDRANSEAKTQTDKMLELKSQRSFKTNVYDRIQKIVGSEMMLIAQVFSCQISVDLFKTRLLIALKGQRNAKLLLETIMNLLKKRTNMTSETLDIEIDENIAEAKATVLKEIDNELRTWPHIVTVDDHHLQPEQYLDVLLLAEKYGRVVRFVRWGQELPSASLSEVLVRNVTRFLKTGRYTPLAKVSQLFEDASHYLDCANVSNDTSEENEKSVFTHRYLAAQAGFSMDVNGMITQVPGAVVASSPSSVVDIPPTLPADEIESKWSKWTNEGTVFRIDAISPLSMQLNINTSTSSYGGFGAKPTHSTSSVTTPTNMNTSKDDSSSSSSKNKSGSKGNYSNATKDVNRTDSMIIQQALHATAIALSQSSLAVVAASGFHNNNNNDSSILPVLPSLVIVSNDPQEAPVYSEDWKMLGIDVANDAGSVANSHTSSHASKGSGRSPRHNETVPSYVLNNPHFLNKQTSITSVRSNISSNSNNSWDQNRENNSNNNNNRENNKENPVSPPLSPTNSNQDGTNKEDQNKSSTSTTELKKKKSFVSRIGSKLWSRKALIPLGSNSADNSENKSGKSTPKSNSATPTANNTSFHNTSTSDLTIENVRRNSKADLSTVATLSPLSHFGLMDGRSDLSEQKDAETEEKENDLHPKIAPENRVVTAFNPHSASKNAENNMSVQDVKNIPSVAEQRVASTDQNNNAIDLIDISLDLSAQPAPAMALDINSSISSVNSSSPSTSPKVVPKGTVAYLRDMFEKRSSSSSV